MRAPFTQLYIHLVWSTWERLPLITTDIEGILYRAIWVKCEELKCQPIAIGGIEDHIHLLIRLDPSVAIADLVKQIKGSTSHLITYSINPNDFFKWQGGYGAFSLRKTEVDTVVRYIQNQRHHHNSGTLKEEWELGP